MAALAASRQIIRASSGKSHDDSGDVGNDESHTTVAHRFQEANAFWGGLKQRMEFKGNLQEGLETPKKASESSRRIVRETGLPLAVVVKSKILADRVRKRQVSRTGLILPESKNKRAWDIFVGAMVVYSVLVTPWRIGFDVPLETLGEAVWEFGVDLVFLTDVVLTFFGAYYVDERLVTDRKKIAVHYLKGWFTVDALSSIPLDLILGLVNGGVRSCHPFPLCGSAAGALASLKLFKTLKVHPHPFLAFFLHPIPPLPHPFLPFFLSSVYSSFLPFFLLFFLSSSPPSPRSFTPSLPFFLHLIPSFLSSPPIPSFLPSFLPSFASSLSSFLPSTKAGPSAETGPADEAGQAGDQRKRQGDDSSKPPDRLVPALQGGFTFLPSLISFLP
jgi:hypothetical protein